MTLPVVLLPDVEGIARAWARSLDLGAASGRVFFGTPKQPVAYPIVTVERIGGLPDGAVPLDQARLTWSVWSDQGKGSAFSVAQRLAAELRAVTNHAGVGGRIVGAVVTLGPRWTPDVDGHLARYVVDALLSVRPVSS